LYSLYVFSIDECFISKIRGAIKIFVNKDVDDYNNLKNKKILPLIHRETNTQISVSVLYHIISIFVKKIGNKI